MEFITRLAWIFGVLSTLLFCARMLGALTYTRMHKLSDDINGVQRSFPIFWPGTVALICWTWVLTN